MCVLCIIAFGLGVLYVGVALPFNAILEAFSNAYDGLTIFQEHCIGWGWFLWLLATLILGIKIENWIDSSGLALSIFAAVASLFLGAILNVLLLEEHPVFCGAFSLLYLVVVLIIWYYFEGDEE